MTDADQTSTRGQPGRPLRADARRNLLTLLQAARDVFAEAGTEAPVRDIAARAGIGVGTVYRHFPRRADLVAAVFRHEIEACADAADRLAGANPPFVALTLWIREFVALASTKRGLAQALHSGDPAFDFMPVQREQRLFPAFRKLYDAALSAGEIGSDIGADSVLDAVATLCMSADAAQQDRALKLAMLLVNGLRCRADE